MNLKRKLISLAAAALLVAAFSACASVQTAASGTSLPADAEHSAIFVLPVDFERNASSSVFGSVRLGITNTESGVTVYHTLKCSTADMAITTLAPGSYRITEASFIYAGGKAYNKQKLDIPFILEAGKITVLMYQFKYIAYKKDGRDYMNWKWEYVTKEALMRIINRYKNAPNFTDWGFSAKTWRLPPMKQAALETGLSAE